VRVFLPVLVVVLLGAGVVAGRLLVTSARTASQALLRADDDTRAGEVSRVAGAVDRDLAVASRAVEDFETAVAAGAVDDRDEVSLRRYLLAAAIAHPSLAELALTTGERTRYEDTGAIVLETEGRRELSAARDSQGVLRARPGAPFEPGSPDDPTRQTGFQAAAKLSSKGQALAGDLEWSPLDAPAAGSWRRKTLTVRKAIFGRGDRFVGVLRASVVSDTLEQLGDHATRDGRTLFVCDTAGRLLTRLDGRDPYAPIEGAGVLRVVPATTPPRVAAALAWAKGGGHGATRLETGSDPTLAVLQPVAARPWVVGSVAGERELLAPIEASRSRSLAILEGALACLLVAGAGLAFILARRV
jgi:hypothetical protein